VGLRSCQDVVVSTEITLLQGIDCRPSGFEPIIFMNFLLLNLLNNTEFSRSLYTDVTHADLQSEHVSSVSGTIKY
jgi:hypothetical protein